ncbi:MAG: signal recognition particle receptor subunit alpha, partial [Atopobiaceae bacterium]|nr:signal recognition particle receptor subunit alpha [Atopobiaceae bacterium]
MALFDRLRDGLSRSRETMNEIFYLGGTVDETFWEDLEDTLVMGDMGAEVAFQVTDD